MTTVAAEIPSAVNVKSFPEVESPPELSVEEGQVEETKEPIFIDEPEDTTPEETSEEEEDLLKENGTREIPPPTEEQTEKTVSPSTDVEVIPDEKLEDAVVADQPATNSPAEEEEAVYDASEKDVSELEEGATIEPSDVVKEPETEAEADLKVERSSDE